MPNSSNRLGRPYSTSVMAPKPSSRPRAPGVGRTTPHWTEQQIATDALRNKLGHDEQAHSSYGGSMFFDPLYGEGGPLEGMPGRDSRSISVTQFIAAVNRMTEDELIQFQQRMYNLGLYGSGDSATAFQWGKLDSGTRSAAVGFFYQAAGDGVSVEELARQGADAPLDPSFDPESSGKNVDISGEEIRLTARDSLIQTAMQTASKLLGRELTPAEREQFVTEVHDKERLTQTAGIQHRAEAQVTANQQGTGEGAIEGTADVDRFMGAIASKESGGNPNARNGDSGAFGKYQFMPSSWAAWTRELGLDPNDKSEANQDRVAKAKMLQLYSQYGNWRDVAIAWYAGGGGVAKAHAGQGGGSQGKYPTINAYGDDVVARMNKGTGPGGAATGGQITGDPFETEDVDPGAEAEEFAKRTDPKSWSSKRVSNSFEEFSSLLSGPTGAMA